MGIGGIGIWQLLIILVIVLLLFGTKKLRNLGGDLGGAIKGFKKAVTEEGKKEGAEDSSDLSIEEVTGDPEAAEQVVEDDGETVEVSTEDDSAKQGDSKQP